MKSRYLELLEEQQKIHKKIIEARESEVKKVLSDIVKEMLTYNISINELKDALASASGTRSRRRAHLPMYINPKTGQTWSGRGRPPAWIVNQDRSKFLITADDIYQDTEGKL